MFILGQVAGSDQLEVTRNMSTEMSLKLDARVKAMVVLRAQIDDKVGYLVAAGVRLLNYIIQIRFGAEFVS